MAELYSKTYSDVEIVALAVVEPVKIPVTIKQGEVMAKGDILARITVSGLYVAYASGGTDGSEEPAGILAMDVDSSSTGEDRAVSAAMYVTGMFYESKLNGGVAVPSLVTAALKARSVPGRDLYIV